MFTVLFGAGGLILSQLPFIGLVYLWARNLFNYHIDFSRTYSHGAMANIRMARNNSRCASNTYHTFGDNIEPDWKFAGDTEFYLNSLDAAQSFYTAAHDWRDGEGFLYTVWPFGPLMEIAYQASSLSFVIATLLLEEDI